MESARYSALGDSKRLESTTMTDQYVRKEYPPPDVTARIIAAAKRVHGELGPGYRELVYQRALALELPIHGLDFS
jgi:hypothetical protein